MAEADSDYSRGLVTPNKDSSIAKAAADKAGYNTADSAEVISAKRQQRSDKKKARAEKKAAKEQGEGSAAKNQISNSVKNKSTAHELLTKFNATPKKPQSWADLCSDDDSEELDGWGGNTKVK